MSDTQGNPIDGATNSVANSDTTAPLPSGETQGSVPASEDTSATPATDEGDKAARQSRRESRAFASQRRENRELSRQIGYLQAQIESLRAPVQQGQTEGDQPPQQRPQPTPQDRAAIERHQAATDALHERLEEAGDEIDGFDKVISTITGRDFPGTVVMRDYMLESDKPAEVAKWLADNPAEARRISLLSDVGAWKALERAEAKLAKATPSKKTTGAPPPLTKVGGSSQAVFDPAKAEMDDYAKWRRSGGA